MARDKNIPISFEVFPPKTLQGFRKQRQTCEKLRELSPRFISVTFGAGGSSQLKSLLNVRGLLENNISAVPHISCVSMTKVRLAQFLEKYRTLGVKQLVVIRGDFPSNQERGHSDFNYASELIEYIRKLTGNYFHITVAAYPEFHPQSLSSDDDLLNFKRKVDAGADSAITQFFFNSDAYFRFRESCEKLDIHIPIIPGIMPIHDYDKLVRFSAGCGAEIPLWMRKRLESLRDDMNALKALGVEFMTKLCERLLHGGAEGLHFYTLNQLSPASVISRNLGF
jgi:methylenetetrahydrofolate reductase (NADPH)